MSTWRNERRATNKKECMKPKDNDMMKIRVVMMLTMAQAALSRENTSRRSVLDRCNVNISWMRHCDRGKARTSCGFGHWRFEQEVEGNVSIQNGSLACVAVLVMAHKTQVMSILFASHRVGSCHINERECVSTTTRFCFHPAPTGPPWPNQFNWVLQGAMRGLMT